MRSSQPFTSITALAILALCCSGCGNDKLLGDADEAVVANAARELQAKADAATDRKIAEIEAAAKRANSGE
jgi:hypothetical protein